MLPKDAPEHVDEDEELIEAEPDGSEDPGSHLDRDATVPLFNPEQTS